MLLHRGARWCDKLRRPCVCCCVLSSPSCPALPITGQKMTRTIFCSERPWTCSSSHCPEFVWENEMSLLCIHFSAEKWGYSCSSHNLKMRTGLSLATADVRWPKQETSGVCACSADSPQRITSACQLDSTHSWMTSSGSRAPESTVRSHRAVGGGSCHSSHRTHNTQSGLMLTQVNIGLEEDVNCLLGLNATCHLGSNGTKGRHTKLYTTHQQDYRYMEMP